MQRNLKRRKACDLQSHGLVVDVDAFRQNVDADSRLVVNRELVVDKLMHQRRLSYTVQHV